MYLGRFRFLTFDPAPLSKKANGISTSEREIKPFYWRDHLTVLFSDHLVASLVLNKNNRISVF